MESTLNLSKEKETVKKGPIYEDLQNIATLVTGVRFEDLKEHAKEDYDYKESVDEDGYLDIAVWLNDIENFTSEMDYDFQQMDWDETINSIFENKYEHYLILWHNSNWQGQTGYKITDGQERILSFGHDVSIDYLARSHSRKYFSFRIYHHDAPTGGLFEVFGLTEAEYINVNNKMDDGDYDGLEDYADKKRPKRLCYKW